MRETEKSRSARRYIVPAFFGPNDVRGEIGRLSARFGERAREIWMPAREGLPRAVIAVWVCLIPILTLSNPWLPSRGVRWT